MNVTTEYTITNLKKEYYLPDNSFTTDEEMLSKYYDIAEIINLDDSFNPITEAPITINSIELNKNGKDDKSLTFNINIPESETNNSRIDEYKISGLNFIVSSVTLSFTNTNGNITADKSPYIR
jgi:hypothetical protein